MLPVCSEDAHPSIVSLGICRKGSCPLKVCCLAAHLVHRDHCPLTVGQLELGRYLTGRRARPAPSRAGLYPVGAAQVCTSRMWSRCGKPLSSYGA